MSKVLSPVALLMLTLAELGGCTGHHLAPQSGETTRPPAEAHATRLPIAKYQPCTAADLTGRLGVIGLGAGQVTRSLVVTNTSGRPCTLTGGPSEVTGVRRDGREVILAAGHSRGASQLYGLICPANLRPRHSAHAVLHTTDMCPKAVAGQTDNFIALEIGISHSGAVRIDFPEGLPYNAICGTGVSGFGIPAPK